MQTDRDWECGYQLGPHTGDTLRHILLQSHPGIGGVAKRQSLGVWSPAGSAPWRHLTSHTATISSRYRGRCKQPGIGGVETARYRGRCKQPGIEGVETAWYGIEGVLTPNFGDVCVANSHV